MTDRPHNPLGRFLAPAIAALVALTPFSLDTYIPALPEMASHFGTSVAAVERSVSTFLIGFAAGQLLGGPLSDHYGRRPIGLIGLSIYLVSTIAILLTDDVDGLLILRFAQAFGGGFATVVGPAMIRDLFDGKEAAKTFALMGFVMLIAPLVGPIVGASLLEFLGWESIFVFLLLYCAALLPLVRFLLPETRTAANRPPSEEGVLVKAFCNYLTILRTHRATPIMLTQTFSAGVLFLFLTEAAFIYMGHFQLTPDQFPITFVAIVALAMVFNRLNGPLLKRWESQHLLTLGVGLQNAGALLFLLLSVTGEANLISTTIALMLAVSAVGFTMPNAMSLYLSHFGPMSGTANAVMGIGGFVMGASLGGMVGLFHDGTLTTIALVVCASAFCSLTALLISWRVETATA